MKRVLARAAEPTAADLRFTPPAFSKAEAAALLDREYGLSGAMDALVGERDQNLRVTAPDGRRYVLKIASPHESEALVDLQISGLEHIRHADPGLPVPRHIETRDGRLSTILTDPSGVGHYVRLLTYLPGRPLGDLPPPGIGTIRDIGGLLGRMCRALRDFSHPAATHFMPWDILNGLVVRDSFKTRYLPPDLREPCAPHFERLESGTLQRMRDLPAQVIHNDAHTGNLLCDPDRPEAITGCIDFGDMIERPLVVDLSCALQNIIERDTDIVGCSRALVGGFARHMPVPDEQLVLLYDGLFARSVLSVQLFLFRLEKLGEDETIGRADLPGAVRGLETLLATDRARFTSEIMSGR